MRNASQSSRESVRVSLYWGSVLFFLRAGIRIRLTKLCTVAYVKQARAPGGFLSLVASGCAELVCQPLLSGPGKKQLLGCFECWKKMFSSDHLLFAAPCGHFLWPSVGVSMRMLDNLVGLMSLPLWSTVMPNSPLPFVQPWKQTGGDTPKRKTSPKGSSSSKASCLPRASDQLLLEILRYSPANQREA